MKAAIMKAGKIEVGELADPTPGPGEVLSDREQRKLPVRVTTH